MGKYNMKKDHIYTFIIIAGIIAGELFIFSGEIFYGLGVHIINLLFITLTIVFRPFLELKVKNILRDLALLILLLLINLSVPVITSSIPQYILTYGLMLIPIYIVKDQMSSKGSGPGPDSESNSYNLVIIFLIGVIITVLQYKMSPVPISPDTIYISGELTTICLIISIIITLLLPETRYWNKYNSDILDMVSNSLLSVFITIAISRIII